jgi:peptidoglycan/LPS O-acetylase OafA/YrhL/lysophospholipase L1-like esterase
VIGLQGLAVLGLLAAVGGLPGGRSVPAVDVLLVTTAFLVTLSVLREQLVTERLSLVRRWQRLLKHYVLVLLIGLGAALAAVGLIGGVPLAKVFRTLVPAVLLQCADWAQFHVQGSLPRWAPDGSWAPAPFGALWPLSAMGQIALCWPLLLAGLLLLLRRSLPALAAVLALVPVALVATPFVLPAATWHRLVARAVFFGGAERLLDLLLGALAACCATIVLRRRGGRESGGGLSAAAWTLAGLLTLAGLVAVSLRSGADAESWARHVVAGTVAELLVTAAAALLPAVLALVLAVGRSPLRSLFSRLALVEFGRIGYVALLIGPVLVWLLRHGWPHLAWYGLVPVGIGLGWLIAICVYYPTGRAAAKPWHTVRAVPLVLAGCLVIGAGAYWLPARAAQILRPHGPELVLGLGDGLAGDFATALNRSGGRLTGANGVATALSGCGVLSAADGHAGCDGWQQEWRDSLTSSEPDAVLLHLGRDAAARTIAGQQQTACAPEYRQQYLARLDDALKLIDSVAPRATVFVLNERLDNSAADPIGTACYNQRVKEFADTHQGKVKEIDLNAELCPVDACRQGTPQGRKFYATVDGTRLTADGQALIAPWLAQQLRLPARTAG